MASNLKRYAVKVRSGRQMVDTILKLTPEEAERLGGVEYVKGKPAELESKSRTATTKPRTPSNKARMPSADKSVAPEGPVSAGFEDATDPGASE